MPGLLTTTYCTRCGEEKALDAFYVRNDGRRNRICKTCCNAADKARRDADPEGYRQRQRRTQGVRNRRHALKSKYGMTETEYDEMLASQGGGCASCGTPPSRRALVVDHDHITNEVRGILCDPCNLILGHAQDDPARLIALATYLETR